jgi:hypothetical protein
VLTESVCVEATSEADTSKRAELRGEQRFKQEVKTSQKEKKDRTRVTADVEMNEDERIRDSEERAGVYDVSGTAYQEWFELSSRILLDRMLTYLS